MFPRIALATLCLVVAAWLALGLRNARLEQHGSDLSSSPAARNPAIAREADKQLADAELLNPDTQPILIRGALAFRQHDFARSINLLKDVVEREPENLPAWRLVAVAANASGDRALAHRAANRSEELSTRTGG